MTKTTKTCEHKYLYRGVVYEAVKEITPGSVAKRKAYYDAYFCEKCLHQVFTSLGTFGSSFDEGLRFDATPKIDN